MNEHAQEYPAIVRKKLVALFASSARRDCAESEQGSSSSHLRGWRTFGRLHRNVFRTIHLLDSRFLPRRSGGPPWPRFSPRDFSNFGPNRRSGGLEVVRAALSLSSNSQFTLRLGATLETPRLDTL